MKYFIYLFILSIFSSCSKPEENFINIPSEFSVTIQEEITATGERKLLFELSSLNTEYCQDDSLVYNTTLENNVLSIEILDSYKSNDCYIRNYFLNSRIRLPDFFDSLQIQLSLGSAALINCTVFNNKNFYTIEIKQGSGLLNKYDKTYKIPNNLIWGYAYSKTSNEEKLNKFKKDIEYDCNNYLLLEGYYSYFSVAGKDLIFNESPGIAGSYLNFYFTHNKSEEQLVQFFNDLAYKYADLVGYKINSGSGKEFKSN